jgi:predicted transcriptional regulator
MTDELAMRLLQATREQLHAKPTREVEPAEIAQKAGINQYCREYETAIRYLLDHGYIEHYQNVDGTALRRYRVTNKGLEEILSNS